ncbi:MAG TPA: flagellar hook protein FlgE [Rhodocyclaceae bacterium]|jgi:flagellar hook protein FlgE|nr:flagellar hook protein FlgE [Rhodocyclaceae bacterium]HMW76415.1 flagellar hook protein FlgE [Rhodocyclaceae bacterium]HNE41973.1 flagellar hook protein FlgE [Rhodocyclaceae bacterium]HNM22803.1 flagellar hook protein FlgE [Rhodocyclaceae bacterium]HNM80731.1 flagellar hook protein FlgE [Rhodocyclaceae bacterium]
MAFQQGLSGLNTASKAIDSTSNNIANASTVGYKAGVAHFADVYANSLAGSGASQIGIGVTLAAIQQQFTQGNITTTNNPLDISINGAGFFRMDSNGAVTYTRNGQFHLDKNGYIVNDQAMRLTGYPALSGIITASTPVPLQISASDLAPVATGSNTSSSFNGVKANVNLDSRQTVPTSAWADGPAAATVGGWTPDPLTYNFSTALSVYDTLGNAHTLTMYFRKAATAGDWNLYANIDGTTNANSGAGALTTLHFDTSGQLSSGNPAAISINLNNVATSLGTTSGSATPLAFSIDFTGSTQFGSPFGTNRIEQDGYASGHLVGLSVGNDGVIQGRYSNGQTFNQGQVVLANFTNPNGLQSLGNNQWTETSVSGPALVGAPNTSNLGVLSSATVEESNVDLTAELVNLITEQRNYQANAQSIRTQDQILQTLVNLR